MQLRSCAYRFAFLASIMLPSIAVTAAHATDCQNLAWSNDQLSKFDVAIVSERDAAKKQGAARQPLEIDAAIASLEQDAATRKGDAAAKGEAVLKELRAGRDAYRAKLAPVTEVLSAATADVARSPEASTNALWDKVNAYLDAVNADVATRQAAMQTKFLGE